MSMWLARIASTPSLRCQMQIDLEHKNHERAGLTWQARKGMIAEEDVEARKDDIRFWALSNIDVKKMYDMLARDPETGEKLGILGEPLKRKVSWSHAKRPANRCLHTQGARHASAFRTHVQDRVVCPGAQLRVSIPRGEVRVPDRRVRFRQVR